MQLRYVGHSLFFNTNVVYIFLLYDVCMTRTDAFLQSVIGCRSVCACRGGDPVQSVVRGLRGHSCMSRGQSPRALSQVPPVPTAATSPADV